LWCVKAAFVCFAPKMSAPALTEPDACATDFPCYVGTMKFQMPELPPVFADLQKRIAELMASTPAADFERHMREVLSMALSRLELVSREEFDQQQQALLRARQKLSELEQRLSELEKKH